MVEVQTTVIGIIKSVIVPACNEYIKKKAMGDVFDKSCENVQKLLTETKAEDRSVAEIVFSKGNINKLEKLSANVSGYDLEEVLREVLLQSCTQGERENTNIRRYTEEFINDFKENTKKYRPDLYDKMFMSNLNKAVHINQSLLMRTNEKMGMVDAKLDKVSEGILKAGIDYYRLDDINKKLIEQGKYNIDLNFFDYDEPDIDKDILHSLKDKKITQVKCKFKEEALYYVLRLLKNNGINNVIIVDDFEKWNKITKLYSEVILIPYFSGKVLCDSGNNKVLQLLSQNEYTSNSDLINLHDRLMRNLTKKLSEYIEDTELVNLIVDQSAGSFFALKHNVFQHNVLDTNFSDINNDSFVYALLLESWTSEDTDVEIIEKFTEMKYPDFIAEIDKFINGPEVFIVKQESINKFKYKFVAFDMAWEIMNKNINTLQLQRFMKVAEQIILDLKKIDNDGIYGPLYIHKYSETLRKGILKSLALLNIHSEENIEQRCLVEATVEHILNTINDAETGVFLVKDIIDLVEAAPVIVLRKLEREVNNEKSFIWNLFNKEDTGGSDVQYIFIAIEKTLYDIRFVEKDIKLLKQLYKYGGTNLKKYSCKSLSKIFSVFYSISELTIYQKIDFMEQIAKDSDLGWRLITSLVPDTGFRYECTCIYRPVYKKVPKNIVLCNSDFNFGMLKYFKIAQGLAANSLQRTGYLLFETCFLAYYREFEDYEYVCSLLQNNKFSDEEKFIFEKRLREFVFYAKLNNNKKYWNCDLLNKIIALVGYIEYDNQLYKDLYAFDQGTLHDLNPQFDLNEDGTNKYDFLKNREEKAVLQQCILKVLSDDEMNKIFELLFLVKDDFHLGNNIALAQKDVYYDHEMVRWLYKNNKLQTLKGYICCLFKKNKNDNLKKLVLSLKDKDLQGRILAAVPGDDSILEIVNYVNCEKAYWKFANFPYKLSKIEDRVRCIYSLLENGSWIEVLLEVIDKPYPLDVYIETLSKIKEYIVKNDIEFTNYDYRYELRRLFNKIYCLPKENAYSKLIIDLEIYFVKIFTSLNCDIRPKYLFDKFDNNPSEVADIVINPDYSSNLYKAISLLKYCPCYYEGKVDLEELKSWCNEFIGSLGEGKIKDNALLFLGKCLANYPLSNDELPPREVCAVLDYLRCSDVCRGYFSQILNSRGAYWSSCGTDERQISRSYLEKANLLEIDYIEITKIFKGVAAFYSRSSSRQREEGVYGI